ncbi:hypothetical protein ACQUJO_20875, partial [Ralstonia pseudosolanacearum]
LERHHLEFVLGGRRALEHPAIKDKGLAGGEAFVSNLTSSSSWFFLMWWGYPQSWRKASELARSSL